MLCDSFKRGHKLWLLIWANSRWQLMFVSCILALGQTKKKALDAQGGFTPGIRAGKLYKPFLLIITRELKQKRF